jgi:nodulation protein E
MIRVGITGMGAISAAGVGVAALWDAARDGVCAVSPLAIPRSEILRIRIAASVRDFDPRGYMSDNEIKRCDRYAQFAHVAVGEALRMAELSDAQLLGSRTAVIFGTGIGGMSTTDDGCFELYSGKTRINPLSIPRLIPSSAASHISIVHKVTGPCFAVTSACASGSQAIGLAAQLIRAGIVDRAIVGGSEACITPATMKAWEMMRVLTPDRCRPFSKDRSGMIVGEGAGAVILESEAAIAARSARPLVWLAGYGTSSDACDIIQPDVGGAVAAMQAALDDAGIAADTIDYINAHGTGTVLNDINEADAINRVFELRTAELPVSSSKPVIGHTLGASGALELIITIKALLHDTVPAHINFTEPDPNCPLSLPTTGPLSRPISAALSNSFAFGGINASLIVTCVE